MKKEFLKFIIPCLVFIGGAIGLSINPLTMGAALLSAAAMAGGITGIVAMMVHDSQKSGQNIYDDEIEEYAEKSEEEWHERGFKKSKEVEMPGNVHVDIIPRWEGDDELRIVTKKYDEDGNYIEIKVDEDELER